MVIDKNSITWDWVAGLTEADGCFSVSLKPSHRKGAVQKAYSLNIEVLLSQKTTRDFYSKLCTFLQKNGVKIRYGSTSKNSQKSSKIRIQDKNSILTFINGLLHKTKSETCFCSQKYRDLLILQYVANNITSVKSPDPKGQSSIKIDLSFSLGKSHRTDTDLIKTTRKPRDKREAFVGLEKNVSLHAADLILKDIDVKYEQNVMLVNNAIKKGKSIMHPDWAKGIADGDGSYNIAINFNDKTKVVSFYTTFILCMETGSKQTLDMFFLTIGLKEKVVLRPTKILQAVTGAVTGKKTSQILDFFKTNTPIHTVDLAQYDRLSALLDYKEKKQTFNYESTCYFVKKCYEVSFLTDLTNGRKYTLAEALAKVNEYFNK